MGFLCRTPPCDLARAGSAKRPSRPVGGLSLGYEPSPLADRGDGDGEISGRLGLADSIPHVSRSSLTGFGLRLLLVLLVDLTLDPLLELRQTRSGLLSDIPEELTRSIRNHPAP